MVLIGPRFRGDVDCGAGSESLLGIHAVAHHVHAGDGVERRSVCSNLRQPGIDIAHSVNAGEVVAARHAIGIEDHGLRRIARFGMGRRRRRETRDEQKQALEIALVHSRGRNQVLHLRGFQLGGWSGVVGLEIGRRGGHRDRLPHGGRLELGIKTKLGIRLEDNAFRRLFGESVGGDGYLIRAGLEVRKTIAAGIIRRGRLCNSSSGIGGHHGGACNCCAGGIGHVTQQCAVEHLRLGRLWSPHRKQAHAEQRE